MVELFNSSAVSLVPEHDLNMNRKAYMTVYIPYLLLNFQLISPYIKEHHRSLLECQILWCLEEEWEVCFQATPQWYLGTLD